MSGPLSRSTDASSRRVSNAKILGNLEPGLLLAMAELQSPETVEARTDLEKLESEARSKGFLLIARKAGAALPR